MSGHVSIVIIFSTSSRADDFSPHVVVPTRPGNTTDADANWRRHRFRTLYDAHHDDLWRYCLRRAATIEEAEEALSETFTVAWRRLDVVPSGDDARPWLFGVARNHLRSGWRRFRRANQLQDRLVHAHTDNHSADPAIAATDGSIEILAALHTLRERDQELLRLAAWEALPHAEIAVILGCSENAVTVRLHRARARLAAALEKADQPSPTGESRKRTKGRSTSSQVERTDPGAATKGGQR